MAGLAALGAYYLAASLTFSALAPFRYSMPTYGSLSYDPVIPILGAMSAIGGAVSAFVAFGSGGVRALALVVSLHVLLAIGVIAQFDESWHWTQPADIAGITTAAALAISVLVAFPALAVGWLAARVLRPALPPGSLLPAAGAYYLAAFAMSLPTPQRDPRLTLPFTAQSLDPAWHAVSVVVPALVAGLAVAGATTPLRRIAVIGALVGLAGAAPAEITSLTSNPSPYMPIALLLVPALSGSVMTAAAASQRRFEIGRVISCAISSRPAAALAGAAAAFALVGAWAVLATMPTAYEQVLRAEAYRRSGDERTIVVCVTSGLGLQIRGASTRESPTSVTVAVNAHRRPSWYLNLLVGIPLPIVVHLRDPLGDRTVIDQRSGDPMRELARSGATGAAPQSC